MYIGILGGSFNPIHVGHIRLAIEALECTLLPQTIDYIDLIPCSIPPHKVSENILPFELRLRMLQASIKNIDGLRINALEKERHGPSYTWDTLNIYRKNHPQSRLLFIVGGEDFSAIPQWFRGLELPKLADIGMVARAGYDVEMFYAETRRHWPEAKINTDGPTPSATFDHGGRLFYLPLLRIDISASYIRERWLRNGSLRMLMPHAAIEILEQSRNEIEKYWNNNG